MLMMTLTDSLLGILGSFEDDSSRALGTSIHTNVDIGTDNISGVTEQVLEVLPLAVEG